MSSDKKGRDIKNSLTIQVLDADPGWCCKSRPSWAFGFGFTRLGEHARIDPGSHSRLNEDENADGGDTWIRR